MSQASISANTFRHGQDDGQVHCYSIDFGCQRRSRCLPVHDRTQARPAQGYWPALGAWVSKIQGPVNPAIPPHLTLMYRTGEARWGYPGDGGFIGMAHAPFRLVGGKENNLKSESMVLQGITLDRLQDRVGLSKAFDTLDRRVDQQGAMDGIDAFGQQAMGILTSSRLKDALDLTKERPEILADMVSMTRVSSATALPAWSATFVWPPIGRGWGTRGDDELLAGTGTVQTARILSRVAKTCRCWTGPLRAGDRSSRTRPERRCIDSSLG